MILPYSTDFYVNITYTYTVFSNALFTRRFIKNFIPNDQYAGLGGSVEMKNVIDFSSVVRPTRVYCRRFLYAFCCLSKTVFKIARARVRRIVRSTDVQLTTSSSNGFESLIAYRSVGAHTRDTDW